MLLGKFLESYDGVSANCNWKLNGEQNKLVRVLTKDISLIVFGNMHQQQSALVSLLFGIRVLRR
jgi:hypothetical protein